MSERPFNDLSTAEAERLALLAEECGEVTQAIGKILRHGYNSTHPDQGGTNRWRLEREIADVMAACQLLYRAMDINEDIVNKNVRHKLDRVAQFLHHQGNK